VNEVLPGSETHWERTIHSARIDGHSSPSILSFSLRNHIHPKPIMSAQDQSLIQDVDEIIAPLETVGCFNHWIATTAVFNAVHGTNHNDLDVCTQTIDCCLLDWNLLFIQMMLTFIVEL
jgi:hypothetical protein